MKIGIIGGNGYIGRALTKKLLDKTEHVIIGISPNVESMTLTHDRLEKHNVDVFDTDKLHDIIRDCDVVFYLIHMMGQKKIDFAEAESLAAKSVCQAIKETKIKRLIYLGGLGNDSEVLSKHLASRHKTGEILRSSNIHVVEFRASMVIGRGSISYDIVTNLIHKLPILTLPKWAKTLTQPIGLDDAIAYLIASIDVRLQRSEIVEIGGPEQLSYGALMQRYASWINKKMFIIKFHVIPVSIAAWWLNLFTPKRHAKVGRIMVESLSNPMVVTNNRAQELFPTIHPKKLEEVFV